MSTETNASSLLVRICSSHDCPVEVAGWMLDALTIEERERLRRTCTALSSKQVVHHQHQLLVSRRRRSPLILFPSARIRSLCVEPVELCPELHVSYHEFPSLTFLRVANVDTVVLDTRIRLLSCDLKHAASSDGFVSFAPRLTHLSLVDCTLSATNWEEALEMCTWPVLQHLILKENHVEMHANKCTDCSFVLHKRNFPNLCVFTYKASGTRIFERNAVAVRIQLEAFPGLAQPLSVLFWKWSYEHSELVCVPQLDEHPTQDTLEWDTCRTMHLSHVPNQVFSVTHFSTLQSLQLSHLPDALVLLTIDSAPCLHTLSIHKLYRPEQCRISLGDLPALKHLRLEIPFASTVHMRSHNWMSRLHSFACFVRYTQPKMKEGELHTDELIRQLASATHLQTFCVTLLLQESSHIPQFLQTLDALPTQHLPPSMEIGSLVGRRLYRFFKKISPTLLSDRSLFRPWFSMMQ